MPRAGIVLLLWLMSASAVMADSPVEFHQAALGNIFIEGEPVDIPVHAEGDDVRWRVTDFFGNQVAAGNETLAAGAADLRPRLVGRGYFTLDVEVRRSGQTSTAAQTVLAIVPHPAAGREASPFGVMTHFAKGWPTDVIPLIRKAGITHIRDEQPWRQVEKQRGDYEFPPRLSEYMAELARQRIDPLVVLAFANPLYDGGKTPFTDEGRAAYAAYATAVMRHYKPGVNAIEIWNEYNGSFCEGPCRDDRAGYYATMLREAYRSLKAEAPAVTVLGGAAVPIPLDYFRSLFEKGALQSMDALVIHPYRKQPEGVEQEIDAVRKLMTRYGAPKPIWATEFSDLSDMHKSRDDVARYLVRMSTLLLAAKVDRMYWYLLRDYQEFTGLGLLRDEADPLGRYTPTPAFTAYATLVHQLDGATFLGREPSDSDVYIYNFNSNGSIVRVAWSGSASAIYHLAGPEAVSVTDMMGGERTVSPHAGAASITLDKNPVYIAGGAKLTADPSGPHAAADLAGDFSLEQGAKGWSYGMIARPDGELSAGASFPSAFQPLRANSAGDGWINPECPPLKIKAAMMHPGRIKGEAAWAVRRWSSSVAGAIRVTGAAELGDVKSAGVSFAIIVDGHVAYTQTLTGNRSSRKVVFDLPLTVASATKIDFAVGPAQAGSVDFDATRISAVITTQQR